jgi:hypothetical protein
LVRKRMLSTSRKINWLYRSYIISENWKSRAAIIDYCVSVVDSELKQKETKLHAILDSSSPSSSQSSNTGPFTPSRPRGDGWQGPSNDFYRATSWPDTLPPQSSTDPEETKRLEASMSIEDRQDFERRRREKENDAKSSLYEERVKVGSTPLVPAYSSSF